MNCFPESSRRVLPNEFLSCKRMRSGITLSPASSRFINLSPVVVAVKLFT